MISVGKQKLNAGQQIAQSRAEPVLFPGLFLGEAFGQVPAGGLSQFLARTGLDKGVRLAAFVPGLQPPEYVGEARMRRQKNVARDGFQDGEAFFKARDEIGMIGKTVIVRRHRRQTVGIDDVKAALLFT